MLTNVTQFFIILSVLYSLYYIRKQNEEAIKQRKSNYDELQNTFSYNKQMIDNIECDVETILEITNNIVKEYTNRLEAQEKLIAELKANQAPKEVVETVNLLNEYLFGAKEE